jgi:peptide/nickel transport system permease protein
MLNYVLRRLAYSVPILIMVIVLTFVLFRLYRTPDQMAITKLGPKSTAVARMAFIKKEGLDQPKLVQLGRYIKNTSVFDFGESWKMDRPVGEIFKRGLVPTLLITVPGFFCGIIMALGLSLYQVFLRNSAMDRGLTIFCVGLMSIPPVVYVIASQSLMALQLNYFPASGYEWRGLDTFRFLALPICILAILNLGYNGRMFRAVFLEEISQDYVRTANAKGVSNVRVLRVHVLKNGMIAIITLTVGQLPRLILGSLLIESFFGIPGMGAMLVQSIQNGDEPVVMASVYLGALAYVFALILTDILYAYADPRIRLG